MPGAGPGLRGRSAATAPAPAIVARGGSFLKCGFVVAAYFVLNKF